MSDDDDYPDDADEPDDEIDRCAECGAHLFEEEHDWNCSCAGEDEDDEL